MDQESRPQKEIIREFFSHFPDYELCRTLAQNIEEGVTNYGEALRHLHLKARMAEENRLQIEEKLAKRMIRSGDGSLFLKDLSIHQILDQDDEGLAEAVRFYFKNPYAHSRTLRTRLLPRWVRTLFLRVLFGHARSRKLELDYEAYHEILRML